MRQPTKKKLYLLPEEVQPTLNELNAIINSELDSLNQMIDQKNKLQFDILAILCRLDALTDKKDNIIINNRRAINNALLD